MKARRASRRRVVRRDVVLDHRYLRLSLDTERASDGAEHTYIHGTGPDIAYAVPLWPDGTVTLNVQRRYGMRKPSVEVPGGHVDPGETPLEGARRELREETGLAASRLTHVVTCLVSIKVQQPMHVFLAEGLKRGSRHLDADEEIECVRVPLDEAVERGIAGWIRHGPSLLALLAVAKHLTKRR